MQSITSWEPAKDVECTFTELQKGGKGKKDKVTERKAFVADHVVDETGAVSLREGDHGVKRVNLCKYVDLPPDVAIFKRMLVHCRCDVPSAGADIVDGRVLKQDADGVVFIIFGCESGELSAVKPGAEVKRFKAGNVRVRRVDGVADAVQEVEGLKKVAAALLLTTL